MFNRRTVSVMKREIRAQVMSKTFIFMTVLMPIIILGVMGLQAFLVSYESKDRVSLLIAEESPFINAELQQQLADRPFVRSGQYDISYATLARREFDAFLDDNREQLIDGTITALVFIPDSARINKRVLFYSSNPGNFDLISKVSGEIDDILVKQYFADKNIDTQDLAFVQKRTSFQQNRVSRQGIEQEGFGNKIVAFAFTFLLMLSVLVIGQQLMIAVNEEKTSRVIEILLSSVNPKELMAGKILGTTFTGLLQMFIWMLPFAILAVGAFGAAAAFLDLNLQIKFTHLLYFFLNYLIGLVTFLSMFAAFGSIFENQQDAQSGIWPLMLLIMVPFYITFSMVKNPANVIAEVSSMLPFASIMVMPARMALIEVPLWQVLLAIAVNGITLFFILRVVGRIYRVGILMTGKRPTWPEVYKWLRYEY